jgi:hypothetical protein
MNLHLTQHDINELAGTANRTCVKKVISSDVHLEPAAPVRAGDTRIMISSGTAAEPPCPPSTSHPPVH